MNSIVGPIFNEKVAEKCNLWVHEQCTNALFTEKKSTSAAKKKKKTAETQETLDVDAEAEYKHTNTTGIGKSFFTCDHMRCFSS